MKFIKLEKDDSLGIVSDILASSATIIGLSFVVIGFSFEVVKDKAQQTLETIFRDTKLYYVFAISIISILLLVVMTALKHTVGIYTLGNFAILSCWLLLVTTISIGYMFGKVITYFDQEKLVVLRREYLFKLARYKLLDDEFIAASEQIYQEALERIGFVRRLPYLPMGANEIVVRWENSKAVRIENIYLPLYLWLLRRLGRHSDSAAGFFSIKYKHNLLPGSGLFVMGKNINVNPFLRWLIKGCIKTSPFVLSAEFEKQKEKLQEKMVNASESGNKKDILDALNDMDQLFSIYRD